jgi:hypothetical protein
MVVHLGCIVGNLPCNLEQACVLTEHLQAFAALLMSCMYATLDISCSPGLPVKRISGCAAG